MSATIVLEAGDFLPIPNVVLDPPGNEEILSGVLDNFGVGGLKVDFSADLSLGWEADCSPGVEVPDRGLRWAWEVG